MKRNIPDLDSQAATNLLRPEPFRIEPIFSPRIWGSRSLAPLFPDKTNLAEPIGEAWLTGVDCRVATGPFAGKTLGEAWREMPEEWRGEKFREPGDFPLLVKFIFPQDKLSIQVHPDDAYAAAHEREAGGRGKTEMWHIVSTKPGAQVLIGLKPGVDKQKFLAALDTNTVEELFQAHAAHEGDTFFLPAGTPHTIGPGMVICEVQQYSDLTYRVYDYGRVDAQGKPRELHVEKALEVMDFGEPKGGLVPRQNVIHGRDGWSKLASCPYFAAERMDFDHPVDFRLGPPPPGRGQFQLVIVLAGEASLAGVTRWTSPLNLEMKPGECWFVPADTFASYGYRPKGKVALLTASAP